MRRSTDQILTTHTGSLPRPGPLRELLSKRHSHEDYDERALQEEIAGATFDVVKQQLDAGISVVNDGEFSKYGFSTYIKDRLSGFEDRQGFDDGGFDHLPAGERRTAEDFPEFFEHRGHADGLVRRSNAVLQRTKCVGPIAWKDFRLVERDVENLTAATKGVDGGLEDVFMSALSPGTVLAVTPNEYYATEEEYLHAVADAMHDEYKAIVDAGFVLQVDCPDLAVHLLEGEYTADKSKRLRDFDLEDFRREVARNIEVLNYATRDLPPEQMRIHVCWGSTEHPHHLDPELRHFVDLLLTARPAGMTIVAANGRHEHEWRVWEDVKLPEGKVIIPGVIDSTTNIVEHPETVAGRILRFASVLGKENVIAGVDCGFGTTAGRDQVEPRVAWAKLRSLGEGARLASAELWK